jgi:hypothetical protein
VKLGGKHETCGCETQSALYGFNQVHMDGESCPIEVQFTAMYGKRSYVFPCVLGPSKIQLLLLALLCRHLLFMARIYFLMV